METNEKSMLECWAVRVRPLLKSNCIHCAEKKSTLDPRASDISLAGKILVLSLHCLGAGMVRFVEN